jgi:Skp family chaperone for outer membrane proteins
MYQVKIIAAIVSMLSVGSLAAAYSQDRPMPSGIPDKKLDQAAAAIVRVDKLQKSYQQKLEQAKPNERDRVVQEAENAVTKAVTDQGLSIDEYDTIIRTARNDPAVREKLLQRMDAQKH